MIRANETVCGTLKNSYKLPFLYTSLNVEFKNNLLTLKNSEFVVDSVKEMLRGSTIKEYLTKPRIIKSFSVSTKYNFRP